MTTTESNAEQSALQAKTINHPVIDPVLTKLASFAADYSAVAAQLAAAEGDQDAARKAWLESTNDAAAVKLREQIAQLNAKLNAMAAKAVMSSQLSEEEKTRLAKERDTLKGQYRDGVLAAKKLAGVLGVPTEEDSDLDRALKAIGDPTRSGKGRPVGSSGNSGPRASVNVRVEGPEVNQSFENLAAAAKATGIELSALQAEFAKAGGVAVSDISQIKTPQEFKVGEYVFNTTPKVRKNAAKSS